MARQMVTISNGKMDILCNPKATEHTGRHYKRAMAAIAAKLAKKEARAKLRDAAKKTTSRIRSKRLRVSSGHDLQELCKQ